MARAKAKPALTNKQTKVEAALQRIRASHTTGLMSLKARPQTSPSRKGELEEEARTLGLSVDRLRQARQFADRMSGYTIAELRHLCQQCVKHGFAIGWSHILQLLTVYDRAARRTLQDATIEKRWSKRHLMNEIKKLREPIKFGGRRKRIPDNDVDVLRQLQDLTDTWKRWYSVLTHTPDKNDPKSSRFESLTFPAALKAKIKQVSESIMELQAQAGTELKAKLPRRSEETKTEK